MRYIVIILLSTCLTTSCNSQEYRLANKSCEGCEAIFEYGDRTLKPVDTLPDYGKYELQIKISGTIYKPDGKTPASDVILYIYHTNTGGKYPTKRGETGWAKRHGYIRGWIKTDASGKYTFYTFKPGSYSSNEAHIHATILEPDGRYYYIDDFTFEGDPNLKKHKNNDARGGSGLLKLEKQGNILTGKRDIILGLNVQNYK